MAFVGRRAAALTRVSERIMLRCGPNSRSSAPEEEYPVEMLVRRLYLPEIQLTLIVCLGIFLQIREAPSRHDQDIYDPNR